MKFCPTHPPTPTVCSTFVFFWFSFALNCALGFSCREAAALDVFTTRGSGEGHKSIFAFLASEGAALPCRGIPPAAGSPLPLLPAACPPLCPFADETSSRFSHPAPGGGGVSPLIYLEQGFDLRLLYFVKKKRKKKEKKEEKGCILHTRSHVQDSGIHCAEIKKTLACAGAKRLRDTCKKKRSGLMIKLWIEALYVPCKWGMQHGQRLITPLYCPFSPTHLILWAHNSTAVRGVYDNNTI